MRCSLTYFKNAIWIFLWKAYFNYCIWFSECNFHFSKSNKANLSPLYFLLDLYCTLEVDSFGYFVSKAKTRVFRDTTEPQWNEVSNPGFSSEPFVSPLLQHLIQMFCIDVIVSKEFEIELEGSQYLRILCYEKCYDKSMLNKDDNEIVDKIMGKGQVQVRKQLLAGITEGDILCSLGDISQHVTHFN